MGSTPIGLFLCRYLFLEKTMAKPQIHESVKGNLARLGFSTEEKNYTIVPFWGCAQEKEGVIDTSCLSNHYIRKFEQQSRWFNCVEQGMMFFKAQMFEDKEIMAKVMAEKWPPNQKRLGRQVKNFDQKVWDERKYDLVRELCWNKFGQNEDLGKFLISFPENVLFVEASPFDNIWGVELPDYAEEIRYPEQWQGENLLGFIHTDNYRYYQG